MKYIINILIHKKIIFKKNNIPTMRSNQGQKISNIFAWKSNVNYFETGLLNMKQTMC